MVWKSLSKVSTQKRIDISQFFFIFENELINQWWFRKHFFQKILLQHDSFSLINHNAYLFRTCLKVVRYTFASLFFKTKRALLKLGKIFLFHFKSFFGSQEKVRILDLQISWRHQMPKQKTKKYIFYWITGCKLSLLMEFG